MKTDEHAVTHPIPESLGYFLVDPGITINEELTIGEHDQNHHGIALGCSMKPVFVKNPAGMAAKIRPAMAFDDHLDLRGRVTLRTRDRIGDALTVDCRKTK